MKPVVAVICDTNKYGPHLFHQAGDKYVQALYRCSAVTPVLIPSLSTPLKAEDILSFANGILFTGGYSNIERHQYGAPDAPAGELLDPARDATSLSLVPDLIRAGLPILGVCRGLQELNVGLGGSLYHRLHEIEGRFDHQEKKGDSLEVQYGPAHTVQTRKNGILEKIVGCNEFMVNSLHGQGIDRIAESLTVEAQAEDGTIEAVSVTHAKAFALAVQWHPEWLAWDNPQSSRIFGAFGKSCLAHQH